MNLESVWTKVPLSEVKDVDDIKTETETKTPIIDKYGASQPIFKATNFNVEGPLEDIAAPYERKREQEESGSKQDPKNPWCPEHFRGEDVQDNRRGRQDRANDQVCILIVPLRHNPIAIFALHRVALKSRFSLTYALRVLQYSHRRPLQRPVRSANTWS
ncbi:hypothetical protein BC938DRAFT_472717 [Jimgerdemannia flammicorona]|uniref:Uncharacterized protein n=1 Tax=Jimgerdemannia flammicorona TaxID=994334 RepID=A0A433QTW2_9FUNG|nr:hypothetical protein BC938DRAFT_472717 [Jimgerdemannia flammicorona]